MYKPNSNRGDHYSNGSNGRSMDDGSSMYARRGSGGSYNNNGSSNNHAGSNGYSNGNGRSNGYRSSRDDFENGNGSSSREFNSQRSFNGSGPRRVNPNQHDQIQLNKPVWNSQNLRPFEKEFYRETSSIRSRPQAILNDFLRDNNVTVAGGTFIKPILDFSECDLPDMIVSKFREAKYAKPTAIQSMCWPTLMSGNDLVGIAQTGSGKTLGFVIPILVHISNNKNYMKSIGGREETPGPVALVLAPTRELAIQIQAVAEEFGRYTGIRNVCIYGGASKGPQSQSIRRGAEIYIATPGRLLDFIKEGTISLNKCTYLVLDEADRMLDMGFEPQIRKLIEQIRPDRQTAMFSATWPKEVRKLAEDFLTTYTHITIGACELQANPNIKQIVEVCEETQKEMRLKEILDEIMRFRDSKVIIFAETKKKVDYYSKYIRDLGLHCLTIHGDKKQSEREWVLNEFRKKPKSILCATDVAARGINIEDIKYVINIDYPVQTEDYIHRIGRTARSTNVGTAYTLLTSDNARHLPKLIEVLRESNQQISDALYNLASRSGVRLNIGGSKFARGGYNNNNSNGHFNGNSRNNNYNNNNNGYGNSNSNNGNGYQRADQRDYSNGPRKRDHASSESQNDLNGGRSGENGTRVKKFRWDEGPAPTNNSRSSPHKSNGYSNGSSSSSRNNTAYGPYPPSSSTSSNPPPQPSSQSSRPISSSSSGYSNEYNQMYNNIQYYQAVAAAAAANGGSWQTAANYSNWQGSSSAAATAATANSTQ